MLQALNTASPKDRAGLERPLTPDRPSPGPAGDDGEESNFLSVKIDTAL